MSGPTPIELDLILRMGLAGLLAGIIGWQRYKVGRPAGARTHALVAMEPFNQFPELVATFLDQAARKKA